MPDDHVEIIKKIEYLKERLSKGISEPRTEHLQLTLDSNEVEEISRYQQTASFKSKSVTIRYLLHAALGDEFPSEHVIRLGAIKNLASPAI
jgi:hypothetical protein